ncbi:hypothetical protein SDC9_207859 [bioreactor metagenome]|uniref:Uncharacterized protein n=1 Tax=bioreactor metagenome TaxID=1076179 RepID=A0A645JIH8_9ZZZZ
MLHQPHHLGEAAGHQLTGEVGRRGALGGEGLVDLRGNDPQPGFPFGFQHEVKLNAGEHAGGGEQAHIPVKKTIQGDLLPLLRENVST